MSLSKKIFIAIAAMILIVSSISASVVYTLYSLQVRESIGRSQLDIAHSTIDNIDLLLSERYGDIQVFSRLSETESYLAGAHDATSTEKLRSKLSQFRLIYGAWETLLVFDDNGKVLIATDKTLEGKSISPQDAHEYAVFQKARQGTVVYSDFYDSGFLGDPTMAFAAPVYAVQGSKEISGVVVGYLDWNVIDDLIASTGFESHLLNTDGTEIASAGTDGAPPEDFSKNPAYISAKKGDFGTQEVQDAHTGESQLTAYVAEKGYINYLGNGWILLLERKSSKAYEGVRKDSLILVLFLTVAGMFMAVLGIILIKRVVFVPMMKLADVSKRIAEGDLKLKAVVNSDDEIGELAHAFNEMTDKLQEMNAGLDAKVKEKTGELSQKLEELGRMNKLMVDRELKMVELKRRIAELEAKRE